MFPDDDFLSSRFAAWMEARRQQVEMQRRIAEAPVCYVLASNGVRVKAHVINPIGLSESIPEGMIAVCALWEDLPKDLMRVLLSRAGDKPVFVTLIMPMDDVDMEGEAK